MCGPKTIGFTNILCQKQFYVKEILGQKYLTSKERYPTKCTVPKTLGQKQEKFVTEKYFQAESK